MKIGVNPYITTPKYQKRQTAVSFQASVPKKIQSEKIFELEEALKPIWFDKEKYLAKLKEFAHIDINSRNFAGDTLITKSAKSDGRFLKTLMQMEKRGEIKGIDWNATDRNGDNIIMLALEGSSRSFVNTLNMLDCIKTLAEEDKIDVNYINNQRGYSLMDCAIKKQSLIMEILALKGIDITKTFFTPIVQQAIDFNVPKPIFEQIVYHPSMDMSIYDTRKLYQYIDRNIRDKREGTNYKNTIENTLKIQNVKTTRKYYQENGILTLNQIEHHVKNTNCQAALNLPLNDIGENIGHFIAETYVDPTDTKSIRKVNEIITELQRNGFYFWKEDDIGRTPLMIALEAENLIVAKAIINKMINGDFHYFATRELIDKLQPRDRDAFIKLLDERLNVM